MNDLEEAQAVYQALMESGAPSDVLDEAKARIMRLEAQASPGKGAFGYRPDPTPIPWSQQEIDAQPDPSVPYEEWLAKRGMAPPDSGPNFIERLAQLVSPVRAAEGLYQGAKTFSKIIGNEGVTDDEVEQSGMALGGLGAAGVARPMPRMPAPAPRPPVPEVLPPQRINPMEASVDIRQPAPPPPPEGVAVPPWLSQSGSSTLEPTMPPRALGPDRTGAPMTPQNIPLPKGPPPAGSEIPSNAIDFYAALNKDPAIRNPLYNRIGSRGGRNVDVGSNRFVSNRDAIIARHLRGGDKLPDKTYALQARGQKPPGYKPDPLDDQALANVMASFDKKAMGYNHNPAKDAVSLAMLNETKSAPVSMRRGARQPGAPTGPEKTEFVAGQRGQPKSGMTIGELQSHEGLSSAIKSWQSSNPGRNIKGPTIMELATKIGMDMSQGQATRLARRANRAAQRQGDLAREQAYGAGATRAMRQ